MEGYRNPDRLMKMKNMILNFRVAELQTLLQRAQMNKTGKKNILQERALSLLNALSEEMVELISELYRQRYSSVKSCVSRNRIEMNPVRSFQNSTARVHSFNVNHHPSTYGHIHPYVMCDPPKYRPMKGMDSRPYAYANPRNAYLQDAVQQSIPYPPSFEKLLQDADCPKLLPSPFFHPEFIITKKEVFSPKKFPLREEVQYFFKLPIEYVNEMSNTRKYSGDKKTYITNLITQLRVSKVNEADDFLPVTLSISCNTSKVALPNLVPVGKSSGQMKRPCVPLNISQCLKLTPKGVNKLVITWDKEDHRNYACTLAISLYMVTKVSTDKLVQGLITKKILSDHESLSFVMNKFNENADDDIAATTLRASAMCPLGKMMIKTPCRFLSCSHVQCFDGEVFIKMNEKRPTWICPVCDRHINFADIRIDMLWSKILKNIPENSKEIEFTNDGTWRFIRPEVKKPISKKRVKEPEIFVIDDSDDESSNQVHQSCKMPIDISDDDDIQCTFVSPNIPKFTSNAPLPPFSQTLFNIGASTSSDFSSMLNLYEIAGSGTRHSQPQQTESQIPPVIAYMMNK